MKHFLLLFALTSFVALSSGCKKVYKCKNTCWMLLMQGDPYDTFRLCNSDGDPGVAEDMYDVYVNQFGYPGFEVSPSISFELKLKPSEKHTLAQYENEDIKCHEEGTYNENYFEYGKFVADVERCRKCYQDIALEYMQIYFDTVGKVSNGFCADCMGSSFQQNELPKIIDYAVKEMNKRNRHCGRPSALKSGGFNMIGYMKILAEDPLLSAEEKDKWSRLNDWLDFNPAFSPSSKLPIFPECP
jgi:hypothetical protein